MRTAKGKIYGFCHKCKWNKVARDAEAGRYVPPHRLEAASQACTKCLGATDPTKSHGGISWVYTGGMEAPSEFIAANIDADYQTLIATPSAEYTTKAPPAVERAMRDFLQIYVQMTPTEAAAFHGILNRKQLDLIAAEQGCTKQNVSKAFKSAMRKCPALAAVAPRIIEASRNKSPIRKKH